MLMGVEYCTKKKIIIHLVELKRNINVKRYYLTWTANCPVPPAAAVTRTDFPDSICPA